MTLKIRLRTLLLLLPGLLFACSTSKEDRPGTLPDLATFSFESKESKLIAGDKSSENAGAIPGCTGVISPSDTVGALALVSVFKKTRCYNDEAHTNGNYQVARGTLTSSNGDLSLTAYQISEPSRKATVEVGSPHAVFYKFPTREEYIIYELSEGSLVKAGTVSSAEADPASFVRVSNLTASDIKGSKTYAFVPSKTKINLYASLATGVEGARVAATDLGDLLKYRYTITGTPFDTATDYTAGPSSSANRYGQNRKYFLSAGSDGKLALIWQDMSSGDVNLTWLSKDRKEAKTTKLPSTSGEVLAAATGDGAGSFFYYTIETGDGAPDTARLSTLFKVDSAGALLKKASVEGKKVSGGLNMVQFASSILKNSYAGALRVSGTRLGLMLGRKMHKASDGLNHQGGIAAVFDTSTLALVKYHGQTSGHSFGNELTVNKDGEFLAIDLGDNYPRGVNLHKFDAGGIKKRVVYTFKTRHGAKAQNPAGKTFDKYDEASKGGTTYYKWSNDNDTYTELGGVVQTNKGYLVFFIGEREPLDNSKVGQRLNTPRNIGFVLVREDFENATKSGSNIVTDDLVLSAGAEEKGGFYTFQGKWSEQRNKGIGWLTAYSTTDKNASRLRVAPLPDGQVLLMWEEWSGAAYLGTYAMKVDGSGSKQGSTISLGRLARLGRRVEPLVTSSGEVLIPAGNKTEKKLELLVVEPIKDE